MSDIVDRLRDRPARLADSPGDAARMRWEAADEIERLRAERDEREKAARWLYKAWSWPENKPVPPEAWEGTVEEMWPWLEGE